MKYGIEKIRVKHDADCQIDHGHCSCEANEWNDWIEEGLPDLWKEEPRTYTTREKAEKAAKRIIQGMMAWITGSDSEDTSEGQLGDFLTPRKLYATIVEIDYVDGVPRKIRDLVEYGHHVWPDMVGGGYAVVDTIHDGGPCQIAWYDADGYCSGQYVWGWHVADLLFAPCDRGLHHAYGKDDKPDPSSRWYPVGTSGTGLDEAVFLDGEIRVNPSGSTPRAMLEREMYQEEESGVPEKIRALVKAGKQVWPDMVGPGYAVLEDYVEEGQCVIDWYDADGDYSDTSCGGWRVADLLFAPSDGQGSYDYGDDDKPDPNTEWYPVGTCGGIRNKAMFLDGEIGLNLSGEPPRAMMKHEDEA